MSDEQRPDPAEPERGCEHLDGPYRRLLDERDELRAENARLRAVDEAARDLVAIPYRTKVSISVEHPEVVNLLRALDLTLRPYSDQSAPVRDTAALDLLREWLDELDERCDSGLAEVRTDDVRARLDLLAGQPAAPDRPIALNSDRLTKLRHIVEAAGQEWAEDDIPEMFDQVCALAWRAVAAALDATGEGDVECGTSR